MYEKKELFDELKQFAKKFANNQCDGKCNGCLFDKELCIDGEDIQVCRFICKIDDIKEGI
jgi:hypothetical protein